MFSMRNGIYVDKLVRLLVAEGLIPEKPGEIFEDVAEKIFEELIDLGMLKHSFGEGLKVAAPYMRLCLIEVPEQDFIARAATLPVRAVIADDGNESIPLDLKSFQIRSLFWRTGGPSFADSFRGIHRTHMETICKMQFLLVLDLYGPIESLPDEVGDLVCLTYLGLYWSLLHKLPRTLGNLQKLQTLDLRRCGYLHKLPDEVLNIQTLRHLLMSKNINDQEIRVPKGIGALMNLRIIEGVYAGGGTACELSTLTRLQELGVNRVSEDHASQLYAAIMKMENLVTLSLRAEGGHNRNGAPFPDLDLFSPPPLVQNLILYGPLIEMPSWLPSMESLSSLRLYFSKLLENPGLVLQSLPKLKHLSLLNNAYKGRCIGKEFCKAGGFPKLETLMIQSDFLVEWSEVVNEAFPSLRYLEFYNCMQLRFLPEGLQNISTLEELNLWNVHGDLGRRLEGIENYKIKHVSRVNIG